MPKTAPPGTTAERVTWVLNHCQTIAVVGLSPRPDRASFDVAQYMQSRGYHIVPINPNAEQVLGQTCYPNLIEAARHHRIDLVNCFRNSEDIAPIVDEALAIGARAIWLQLGQHDEFREQSRVAKAVESLPLRDCAKA